MNGDYRDAACRDASAKWDTREAPLRLVRERSSLLVGRDGVLRYSWAELAGVEAPTFRLLLQEGAFATEGRASFIGVDNDEAVIATCRERYGDTTHWVHTTMHDFLRHARHQTLRENVGVLVYDSHDAVVGSRWRRSLKPVLAFAREQHQRLGEFLLVLNLSRQGGKRRASDAQINVYTDWLSGHYGSSVKPADLHTYRSNKTEMLWLALPFGF